MFPFVQTLTVLTSLQQRPVRWAWRERSAQPCKIDSLGSGITYWWWRIRQYEHWRTWETAPCSRKYAEQCKFHEASHHHDTPRDFNYFNYPTENDRAEKGDNLLRKERYAGVHHQMEYRGKLHVIINSYLALDIWKLWRNWANPKTPI